MRIRNILPIKRIRGKKFKILEFFQARQFKKTGGMEFLRVGRPMDKAPDQPDLVWCRISGKTYKLELFIGKTGLQRYFGLNSDPIAGSYFDLSKWRLRKLTTEQKQALQEIAPVLAGNVWCAMFIDGTNRIESMLESKPSITGFPRGLFRG